jgi:hypothetical protein
LKDGQHELERLNLVKAIPGDLALDLRAKLEANAFNVLTSLLNLVGSNVSYFATFRSAGKFMSKTGKSNSVSN